MIPPKYTTNIIKVVYERRNFYVMRWKSQYTKELKLNIAKRYLLGEESTYSLAEEINR